MSLLLLAVALALGLVPARRAVRRYRRRRRARQALERLRALPV